MKYLTTMVLALWFAMITAPTHALTLAQFNAICADQPVPCTQHPALHAYIGGAIDLLVAMRQNSDYLSPMTCALTPQHLDVNTIITFMTEYEPQSPERDAMAVLLEYLQAELPCKSE